MRDDLQAGQLIEIMPTNSRGLSVVVRSRVFAAQQRTEFSQACTYAEVRTRQLCLLSSLNDLKRTVCNRPEKVIVGEAVGGLLTAILAGVGYGGLADLVAGSTRTG